jgi:hypothetical protein
MIHYRIHGLVIVHKIKIEIGKAWAIPTEVLLELVTVSRL